MLHINDGNASNTLRTSASYNLPDGKSIPLLAEDISRFVGMVAVQENGCWGWTGYRLNHGEFGMFSFANRDVLAARFSYCAFNGELKAFERIKASCDDKFCVNPNHLKKTVHPDSVS